MDEEVKVDYGGIDEETVRIIEAIGKAVEKAFGKASGEVKNLGERY